jgi:hypothetical protein
MKGIYSGLLAAFAVAVNAKAQTGTGTTGKLFFLTLISIHLTFAQAQLARPQQQELSSYKAKATPLL